MYIFIFLFILLLFFFFFCFLGPHLPHMEVPGLEGRIEAAATVLHHSHGDAEFKLLLQHTPPLTAMPDP